jgi:RNA polymerase sigma factor for flagellar operon FliA
MEHLWLVRHILGRLLLHLPAGLDLENLEAAGTLGLVEAAGKFDPRRGIKFKTFAFRRIRGAILDELRRNCPVPQHMLERISQVRHAYQQMQAGIATVEMLAESAGMDADQVSDCLAAMRFTRMLSLEESTVSAGQAASSCTAAELREEKERLAAAIALLPDRDRLAVTLYYLENLRLKEIGQLLHLSESRVSRVLSAALFRLRELLRGGSSDDSQAA